MGLMTNMQSLHIKEAANLSGTLPTELGLMTNLTSMVLSFTNREGTLPVEYSNLTKLATLDLFNNKGLTGSLPTEYSQLVNLRTSLRDITSLDCVLVTCLRPTFGTVSCFSLAEVTDTQTPHRCVPPPPPGRSNFSLQVIWICVKH